MKYPCIVYKRQREHAVHADGIRYKTLMAYSVTVIDPDPDSPIPGRIAELPYTDFDTHFTAENLNHDVFTIYF